MGSSFRLQAGCVAGHLAGAEAGTVFWTLEMPRGMMPSAHAYGLTARRAYGPIAMPEVMLQES